MKRARHFARVVSENKGVRNRRSKAKDEKAKQAKKQVTASRQRAKKTRNLRKEVQFKSRSYDRRNVNKHIVRYLILHHEKYQNEISSLCKKQGADKEEYENLSELLRELRSEERSESFRGKKDYAVAIDVLLATLCGKVALYVCLNKSSTEIHNRYNKRIHDTNMDIYQQTISDYVQYIKDTLGL